MEKETAKRAHKVISLMNKTEHEIEINSFLKQELKDIDNSGNRCMDSLGEFLFKAEEQFEANGMLHRAKGPLYKRIWEAIEKHLDDDIAYLNIQLSHGEKILADL